MSRTSSAIFVLWRNTANHANSTKERMLINEALPGVKNHAGKATMVPTILCQGMSGLTSLYAKFAGRKKERNTAKTCKNTIYIVVLLC